MFAGCSIEGPVGPAGPPGESSPQVYAEAYYTQGFATTGIHNAWVETTPALSVTVPEDGTYFVMATGQTITYSGDCSSLRVLDTNLDSVVVSSSCGCAGSSTAAYKGTGSVSRILHLASGHILQMQFRNEGFSTWQYGGNDASGASSLSIIKLDD